MSLKAFHLVFITAAIVLAFGVGVWLWRAEAPPEERPVNRILAGGSIAAGVVLVVYEICFLRKTRHLRYL
jgi:hypothetical protein